MLKNSAKLLLAIILLSISNISYAQDNIVDEIIWVIGDEAILKSDVERARIELQMRGQRFDGDPYCFIPEQLAEQKLFLDQAKIDSLDASPAEINAEVDRYENNIINIVGSKEKVEEYLRAPMIELRSEWRDQFRNDFLVLEAKRSIMDKNKDLTPSEVRKYYNSLPKDSLPYIPTNVEVQIITYNPTVPLSETDRVKERLRNFTHRINEGETSFATLAIAYSEDGSSPQGGELGLTGRATLYPEFANAAFALSDPSKISNVVETESGYHIIQLIERKGDKANFRHILLKPKISDSEMEKANTKMDSLAKEIRAAKFSFEEAAEFLSADKETRKSGGLMVNQKRSMYGIPRFALEELPAEIAKVVDKMSVGEISAPFKMKSSAGKDIIAIIKLRNKIEGHIANVSEDYQVLREIVEDKNREAVLDKWLQKKISETYIRINPKWANCDFKHKGWLKTN